MMGLLTRNLGWKLLALGLAVFVWVLVSSEPELASFVSVPVQYQNLPEDLEISSNALETVSLELRGPAGQLRDFGGAKGAVVLDMSAVSAGERTFSISTANVDLPRGLRLVRAIPAQLRYDFEKRMRRAVPVEVRFTNIPRGYTVADAAVSPSQLTIVGPESRVERVARVVTDPVDAQAAGGPSGTHANTFVDEPQVRFVSNPRVTVTATLRPE